jgi:hypothetical protein
VEEELTTGVSEPTSESEWIRIDLAEMVFVGFEQMADSDWDWENRLVGVERRAQVNVMNTPSRLKEEEFQRLFKVPKINI